MPVLPCKIRKNKLFMTQGTLWIQSSWKLGHLFIESGKLLFAIGQKRMLEIGLENISKIQIVKRKWLFGVSIRQLKICYDNSREEKQAYIALAEPEKWRGIIEKKHDTYDIGKVGLQWNPIETPKPLLMI